MATTPRDVRLTQSGQWLRVYESTPLRSRSPSNVPLFRAGKRAVCVAHSPATAKMTCGQNLPGAIEARPGKLRVKRAKNTQKIDFAGVVQW
jgi:hypothetical protein